MRLVPAAPLLVILALAGCIAPAADVPLEAASDVPVGSVDIPVPVIVEWSGYVLTSAGEALTHFRPTEDVLWPIEQEGILVEFTTIPKVLEVALEWTGPGSFMIMLHSHKGEDTNVYSEHITALDAENPKCLRVPTEDIVGGHWQVMVHSEGAQDTAFTLKVITIDGAAEVVEDDRHGHWPQDGAFEVEQREIEACSLYAPVGA